MVKCKTVSISEIKEDNPRLCLLPIRFTDNCYSCDKYPKCDSRKENKQYEEDLKDFEEKKKELKKIQEEVNILKSRLFCS